MISPVETWVAERTGLSGRLNPESLAQWQVARLREVLEHARANSRFYSQRLRGVDPASVESLADLVRLPFTSPAEIAREPLAFLCVHQAEVARVTTLMTSGTLGVKKRIFFTQRDLQRTVDFFAIGMKDLVSAGQTVLILMPGNSENSIGRLLQSGLACIGVSSCIGGQDWSAGDVIDAARTSDCIVGIPQEVFFMCRTDSSLRPKSVLLSADFVPGCVIRELEGVWKCRVFTHYGMTETGFGCAVQCTTRESHHLRDADLLVEIIDPGSGKREEAGQCGEIVITTLQNEAMPLFRYRTGDVGRMENKPCACGGVLQRLGRVDGRRENDLILPDGEVLSIHRLDELLFGMPGVRAFNAELRRSKDACVLMLTIDAIDTVKEERLVSSLPRGIDTEIRYAEINPLSSRAKRSIRTGGLPLREDRQRVEPGEVLEPPAQ